MGISVYFLRRSNNSGKYAAQLQHGPKVIEITWPSFQNPKKISKAPKFSQKQYSELLTAEVPLLKISHNTIRSGRESESQLKANITTILCSTELPNGSSKPDLCHTQNRSHNTEGESNNCCDPWRQLLGVHVDGRIVTAETALVEDVLRNRDT